MADSLAEPNIPAPTIVFPKYTPELADAGRRGSLSAQTAWWSHLRTRLTDFGWDDVTCCRHFGITGSELPAFQHSALGFSHPALTKIANTFGVYNLAILQAMSERGEVLPNISNDDSLALIRVLPASAASLDDWLGSRRALLCREFYREAAARPVVASPVGFSSRKKKVIPTASELDATEKAQLSSTGGNLKTLKRAPENHIYYLFSLGDTASAALYILHNQHLYPGTFASEITAAFVVKYSMWLRSYFGRGASFDSPSGNLEKMMGARSLPVRQYRAKLEQDYQLFRALI
jgi:hypothetical protein